MKKINIIKVIFQKIITFIIFLGIIFIINVFNFVFKNNILNILIEFLNQNIGFLFLILLTSLITDLFLNIKFPFNLIYPLFNLTTGVLTLIFIEKGLNIIFFILEINLQETLDKIFYVILIIIILLIIILDYSKIINENIINKKSNS